MKGKGMLFELRSGGLSTRLGAIGISIGIAVFAASSAQAGPLGLQYGDEIQNVEVDGLIANGDGFDYDFATTTVTGTGRPTAVVVDRPGPGITSLDTSGSGAELRFGAGLTNYLAGFINPPANTLLNTVSVFSGVAGIDFNIVLGATVIMEGEFSGPLLVSGLINTAATSDTLLAFGNVTITGGVANVVAAFGTTGQIQFSVAISNFNPNLTSLAGDGNIVNSDFIGSFSGLVTPVAAAPFVPEPGTAALLGGGLVGLLACARRARGISTRS